MRIACVSDIHGYLPDIPDCDVFLIGGDIVPREFHDPFIAPTWLESQFKPWIAQLAKRMIVVGVAGNHDFVFQKTPHLVPKMDWIYLQDGGTQIGDLKIWGSPWQPWFYNWAFNLYEPDLREKWALIPEDTDVLLLHGPPHGYGDLSVYDNVHTGSPSLTERILEIRPKLVVAGHIHSGYGSYNIGETLFINASYVDESYKAANPIIVVDV